MRIATSISDKYTISGIILKACRETSIQSKIAIRIKLFILVIYLHVTIVYGDFLLGSLTI